MTLKRLLLALLIVLGLLALARPPAARASVGLRDFRAESGAQQITLLWATEFELDNLGFYVHRGLTDDRTQAERISPLIPGNNSVNGSDYEFTDTDVESGVIHYYWLEDIDNNGVSNFNGPIQATLAGGITISTPTPRPTQQATATVRPTNTATPTTAATQAPSLPTNTPPPTATRPPAQPTATPPPPVLNATQPPAQPTTPPTNAPADGDDEAQPTPQPVGDEAAGGDDAGQVAALPTAGQTLDESGGEEGAPAQAIGADTAVRADEGAALPAPADASEEQPSGSGRFSTTGIIVLLIGLALSASGGAATWYLLKRN